MPLSEIEPHKNERVMDLVKEAGLDISDWAAFKGGPSKAASNPKYCYEWCFVEENLDLVVLNLWFDEIKSEGKKIYRQINMRNLAQRNSSKPVWKKRALKMDNAIRMAYESQLPLRIIVGSGVRRTSDDMTAKASIIHKRLLDPVPWAVASYDIVSGDGILERGLIPTIPKEEYFNIEQNDIELPEGALKERLTKHRKRESALRRRKIHDVLNKNNGRLICEVKNCGFDFIKVYGALGEGYAQVHHIIPLSESPAEGRKTSLNDLAIVCANCHVMIHRNGECRPMETLIAPKARQKKIKPRI